jgi:rhodanese-related sulfurtransferase
MLRPMPRVLSVQEAQTLIDAGDVDVIDVREANEYSAGHVPGARSLPLSLLKTNPRQLSGDRMLFICAKGMRSMTAAQLAESVGIREAFSLDGGTIAWAHAGLPIER